MIPLDDAYVDAAAPNAEAIKNGRSLVLKNKFIAFHISEDQSILFGECQGAVKSLTVARAISSAKINRPIAVPVPAGSSPASTV